MACPLGFKPLKDANGNYYITSAGNKCAESCRSTATNILTLTISRFAILSVNRSPLWTDQEWNILDYVNTYISTFSVIVVMIALIHRVLDKRRGAHRPLISLLECRFCCSLPML
jgi:hypothetical protein